MRGRFVSNVGMSVNVTQQREDDGMERVTSFRCEFDPLC
jgi:hypothetical protein